MSPPRIVSLMLVIVAIADVALAADPLDPRHGVDATLTAFHAAASEADGETYFGLFADGGVFIGTDPSERWTVDDFRAFAKPYFDRGQGWTYTATERHIEIAPDSTAAWFDELLWNDTYGTCRGTGVLVLTADGWRLAQYHLAFPIPNELSAELTARIREHARGSEG